MVKFLDTAAPHCVNRSCFFDSADAFDGKPDLAGPGPPQRLVFLHELPRRGILDGCFQSVAVELDEAKRLVKKSLQLSDLRVGNEVW